MGSSKAHYNALIYFPELADVTAEHNNSVANYRLLLPGSGCRPTHSATRGTQAASYPDFQSQSFKVMNGNGKIGKKV